ncbi:MAG: nitroreductase family protein [Chloroflexi bacterium]|nr:nitroreductase family protein [Chloroflexota bacterium]
MEVWEAIRKKRAVRVFKNEPLPEEAVTRILDAGRRSQSSKNTQPWDFIAIRDHDQLQKVSELGQWTGHVAGAAMCVAIVVPAPQPGQDVEWKHMFDAGQAASYMQLAALEIGVGSCLGTVYKPDEARQILGYPTDKTVNIVISFGYPAEQPTTPAKKGGRRPLQEVIHWDRW